MDTKMTMIVLAAILGLAGLSEAEQCYSCHNQGQYPGCGNPFQGGGLPSISSDSCQGCYSAVTITGETERWDRGCKRDDLPCTCNEAEGVTTCTYCCTGDLCNTCTGDLCTNNVGTVTVSFIVLICGSLLSFLVGCP